MLKFYLFHDIEHHKYEEKQNTKFSFDYEYMHLFLNAASLPQECPYLHWSSQG